MSPLSTYLKRPNLAVIAIGAVLVGYIAFLLMANYHSQIKLQKSGLELMRHDTEGHTVAVSYFFSERKNDLKNLTETREISAFYENKALGMSMEYGLGDSVFGIAKLFDHFLESRRIVGERIYKRIVFLESNGAVLADRPGDNSNPATDQNLKKFLDPEHPDPQIIVESQGPFWQIMISTPYFFKGAFSGQIIAWLSSEAIYRQFIKTAGGASQRLINIINARGEPLPSLAGSHPEIGIGDLHDFNDLYASATGEVHRFESSRENGSKVDLIAMRVPIPDTSFFLVAVAPAAEVLGRSAPRQLLAVTRILALAILGGVVIIVVVNNRNLLLHARFEEAAERRQEVEEKNRQLEQEIRERQLAEQGRRESEEKYRLLVSQIPAMVFQGYGDWSIDPLDEKIKVLTGYSKEDFDSRRVKWCDLIPAEDLDYAAKVFIEALKTDKSYVREHRLRRKDGEIIWVQCRGQIFLNDQGKVDHISGVSFDVTQRRLAEEAVREGERFLADIFASIQDGINILDTDYNIIRVNPTLERWYDHARPLVGKKCYEVIHGQQEPCESCPYRQTLETGKAAYKVTPRKGKDGAEVGWIEVFVFPIMDLATGQVKGVIQHIRDITERRQAEEALQERERFLTSIFASIQDGINVLDNEFNIVRVNQAMERAYAQAMPLVGKKCYEAYHGRREPCDICPARTTLETGGAAREMITEKGAEGEIFRYVELFTFPLLDMSSGQMQGVVEYVRDITARQQAEEALRQSEEQLRQAVKMEAVGRLAGGVAHDFNNILTAITGYSDLLLLNLDQQDPQRQDVQDILVAADRAASLTRQLLAFSRKQVLQPQRLDLNRVVANMDKMLRRIIGEDIDLVTVLGPELGTVTADPGQIEQVVMNLAVNARDAMPQGGKLTIETVDVDLDAAYAQNHLEAQPGPYVMLAVSDTGVGLDQEAQARIFEPFFTTKELGKGTGLGLSTVYGIVKQSGGLIWVYSEPGKGTTFKIYLPRLDGAGISAGLVQASAASERGSEIILLVEDEDMVRHVARRILARLGYTVLEAASGLDALVVSREHAGPIHLMLTDVVMPGMSGWEIMENLKPQRPGMKVLFMSGHTENAIVHHGVLNPGTAFIQKPFKHDFLAHKVREVLDNPAAG
jgi:PAS domain S-box-containing protein